MHGGVSIIEKVEVSKEVPQTVLEDSSSQNEYQASFNEDIVDAGAVDHSSDSDYEPSGENGEELIEVAVMNRHGGEEGQEKKIGIKLEGGSDLDDKPNILKRKAISPVGMKPKFTPKKVKEEYLPPVSLIKNISNSCII